MPLDSPKLSRGVPMQTRLALALALLLSSCQAGTPITPDHDQPTPPQQTPAVALPPSWTPTGTTQLASPSIPSPTSIASLPPSWTIYDPQDPTTPPLVQQSNGSYRLDPSWQVDRIEYVYEWWGLGDPILDYQVVLREEGGYRLDDVHVQPEVVDALIASLTDLHPSQFSLVALSHTDDYPSWRIELVGDDGRRLLVYSSSTGNPGAAPWNVLDNGRLFAQYSGAVAQPMSDLFHSPQGQPAAAFFPGGWDPDHVYFATAGRPPQLSEGFEGLLPVSERFHYTADATSGVIRAFLQGRSSIGGFGNMVLGEITALNRASLSSPDATTVPCTIEALESEDPSEKSWALECQVGPATPGAHFRLPVELEVSTSNGRHITIDGALVGAWDSQDQAILLPPPVDVYAQLAADESAAAILRSHPAAYLDYTGSISSEGSIAATGEAILLGEINLAHRAVPYTLATPFSVDGRSVEWALTPQDLDQLILDVTQTPLVTRALASLQNVTLDLYYSEPLDLPEFPMLLNSSPADYSISVAHCGAIPSLQVPSPQNPLRAFSLDGLWAFDRPQFVLDDTTPLVVDLDLWPYRDDPSGVLSLLTPPELNTGSDPPFERIWMQSDSVLGGGHELTLWVPSGIDPTTTEPYSSIFSSLPVPVEHWAESIWVARAITFPVGPDGSVLLSACAAQ
jgi:hypothetical protein